MDRSVTIALVIFVFLWIVILKYCIETNDWTGFNLLKWFSFVSNNIMYMDRQK